ncbi:MAG TPA: response regulator transcription factor [Luteibacter sp.]|jgi:DNA-binding NarL/FixJ family response regulator|nr:response regulator transcription factor [Luteibacter sp.]
MYRATVVLAEDHPRVADEIARLLSEDFELVGVVAHGAALVTAATRLKPDVVVTDIGMPGMDGIEAARQLSHDSPGLAIVFVSMHDDPGLARRALLVGDSYVLKSSAGEELLDAVHAALRGEGFVSAQVERALRRHP